MTEITIELAVAVAKQIGRKKLEQARKDRAPIEYCVGIEATYEEIAAALQSYGGVKTGETL
jgi:hypothetical protein